MNILMLAPEPYFQPRGTPISVYFRLKALSELGHRVDLVTYPLGKDEAFPLVSIHRTLRPPLLKRIKVGPSLAKILLDVLLFVRSAPLLLTRSYDLVFSHEEASWFGAVLARIRGIPHLYDMHSSLPQQLENFRFTRSRILVRLFARLERFVLRTSRSVIVICPALLEHVERMGFSGKAVLLENFLDFDHPLPDRVRVERTRKSLAPGGWKIVLYAGNFEPYQGIPLLLDAAALMSEEPVVFLLVGGKEEHVKEMKKRAAKRGIEDRVHFTGTVPPREIPVYIAASDALVSPRVSGTNTPLKIYSFLKSGKPLVATSLFTHTQVLDDHTAVLVRPTPQDMAEGLRFALFDEKARKLALAARAKAEREFTPEQYRRKLGLALEKAVAPREERKGAEGGPAP